MGADVTAQLRPFMEPRSVAVVGVSRRTGEEAFNILENMLHAGYEGSVYPVNPNASEILGLTCYPDVNALPDGVDLAVVALPRDAVLPAVEACVGKGIRCLTVVAQGFADAGDRGRAMQRELVSTARRGEARVVGPNTFGTANAFARFHSAFVLPKLAPVPVGLICQTGVFFVGFPGLALLGKGFDLGNACDVDHAEALEYFARDPQVKIVVQHIEGLEDGRHYLEVAEGVARHKPLLVWKTGLTEESARMVQSHTGSLVGRDEVWQAALKRAGATAIGSLDDLRDMVTGLTALPPLRGRRLGVVTFTGGYAIMALDAAARHNLAAARLGPGAKRTIASMAPPWHTIGNPVDIWPVIGARPGYSEMVRGLSSSFHAVLSEPGVDALLFIGGAFTSRLAGELYELLAETAERFPAKPVTCYLYGAYGEQVEDMALAGGRVAVFPSVERAVRTLSRLADYYGRCG